MRVSSDKCVNPCWIFRGQSVVAFRINLSGEIFLQYVYYETRFRLRVFLWLLVNRHWWSSLLSRNSLYCIACCTVITVYPAIVGCNQSAGQLDGPLPYMNQGDNATSTTDNSPGLTDCFQQLVETLSSVNPNLIKEVTGTQLFIRHKNNSLFF